MTSAKRQRLQALPTLLVAAALLGTTAWHGVPLLVSDLQSQAARKNVDTWARQQSGWTEQSWQQARTALLNALALAPDDPVLHVTLAQLYITQGGLAWGDAVQRQAYFGEALDHQRRAVALRPTDGYTWSQVAISLYALDAPVAEVQQAWAQAVRYAPREAPVQRSLVDLTLGLGDRAPPDMRAWALQTWRDASPAQRQRYEADARKWGREGVFR